MTSIVVTSPPRREDIIIEITERRTVSVDFSGVLGADIATLTSDDPEGLGADLQPAGRVAHLSLLAGEVAATALVTISAATLAGRRERQTLRVRIIDPAAGIQEVYP